MDDHYTPGHDILDTSAETKKRNIIHSEFVLEREREELGNIRR